MSGNVAQRGHFLHLILDVVGDESAEDEQRIVLHEHGGFHFALAGDQIDGALHRRQQVRDFLMNVQAHVGAEGDVRRDGEREADVLALDGLERIADAGLSCLCRQSCRWSAWCTNR